MDWAGYQTACRYLGLHPEPRLYRKCVHYLLIAAASQPAPAGFQRWLAERQAGPVRLGFLDLWTRLLMPAHPWRFRLNALLALHECDPRGSRHILAQPRSKARAWLSLIGIGSTALLNLLAGGIWLGGEACAYAFFGRCQRREQARFRGQTVLITGAARGLGLALSLRLLALGARVVGVARAGAGLDALRNQLAAAGMQGRFRLAAADVSQPGAMVAALAAIGVEAAHIDTAILNAGIKEEAATLHPDETLQRTFAVNLFAAADAVSMLLPAWQARDRGHLIYLSSLGRWHGMTRTGSYNASKAALSVLAESVAMDLHAAGRHGIATTLVEPGLIRTGMVGSGLLQKLLSVDTDYAARRILRCAAHGTGTCRFPWAFTGITLVVALLPLALRLKLLSRMGNTRTPPT